MSRTLANMPISQILAIRMAVKHATYQALYDAENVQMSLLMYNLRG